MHSLSSSTFPYGFSSLSIKKINDKYSYLLFLLIFFTIPFIKGFQKINKLLPISKMSNQRKKYIMLMNMIKYVTNIKSITQKSYFSLNFTPMNINEFNS